MHMMMMMMMKMKMRFLFDFSVIRVGMSKDVSSQAFRTEMEQKLAAVYSEAYQRIEMEKNGTWNPDTQGRRRRKRAASSGDTAVQVRELMINK